MEGCTGEIRFACGRGYTEVPQKAIKQVSVGTRLCVFNNETHPKRPEPIDEYSCLDCPCKRKAKHKKDKFWHPDDMDSNGEPNGFPSGIAVMCNIVELIEDKS